MSPLFPIYLVIGLLIGFVVHMLTNMWVQRGFEMRLRKLEEVILEEEREQL